MFLALTNIGRDQDLQAVAIGLLRALDTYLPDVCETQDAHHFWENGLKDPESNKPNKELADRSYLVIHYAVKAIQDHKSPLNPHGRAAAERGEIMACTAIRAQVPLAPSGFRKVGRASKTKPAEASAGARALQARLLGHGRRVSAEC